MINMPYTLKCIMENMNMMKKMEDNLKITEWMDHQVKNLPAIQET